MMVSRRGQLESLQHEGKDAGMGNQYYIVIFLQRKEKDQIIVLQRDNLTSDCVDL